MSRVHLPWCETSKVQYEKEMPDIRLFLQLTAEYTSGTISNWRIAFGNDEAS